MLENVVTLFEDMNLMMGRLKKKSYEHNMNVFREKYNFYFDEMVAYVENSEDKDNASKELAECFCGQIAAKFMNKRGKVPGRKQIDINLFMIYYVFPAIRMIPNDNTKLICDNLCAKWNETFKVSIAYTEYNKIYESFQEKLFGFF